MKRRARPAPPRPVPAWHHDSPSFFGFGAAAARLAAHRALIASASWARRSGERLSVLFTLVRLAARRAAAARAAAFLFAAALIRFHQRFKFPLQLGEFLGTFLQPSFESTDLFFKSFSFHKGANCLAYMIDERKNRTRA